ncbi:MAG: TIGR02147 family protein [Oligoflexales bacterium]|nr:TIGR02147 family protein [Oligoflexales bacterium]
MKNNRKTSLSTATRHVPATSYLDYREYLEALYQEVKSLEKRYSYLEFAEDLGFSRTNVIHLSITGKRPLTSKAAAKIISSLGLSGVQKQYFEALVAYQNSRNPVLREELFQSLIALKGRTLSTISLKANLEFFSEWYHSAIYEMTFMDSFNSDPHWIAGHIMPRIRPFQAQKSLELLTEIGLVTFNIEKGRHEPTARRVTTGDEIASLAVVRYHQKMIEIGRESITGIDETLRDISAITFSIPASRMEEYKKEISEFRKRLLAMADETVDKDVVYQLNIQLFPLSRSDRE